MDQPVYWSYHIQAGHKPGTYITDNEELKSNNMRDWLASRGTNQLFTAPYTSTHNGCVECMHHTLWLRLRQCESMQNALKTCGTNFTWQPVISRTKWWHNHSKEQLLRWHDWKPDYSYLREISCQVFVLIQNKHNLKICNRYLKWVLIGYDINSKTYRCYHCETNQVISSYHVRFLESHDGHLPSSPESPWKRPH